MQGRTSEQRLPAGQAWWRILDPRCSLRARAALLVSAGTVAFTFVLSGITATLYRRTLESHLASTFEMLAFQVGDKLDRAVYERYRSLQFAVNLAAIRDVGAPAAERRRVLDALREASSDFAWLGLTDASGRVVAATGQLFEGTTMDTRPWYRAGRERPFVGPLHEVAELTPGRSPSASVEQSRRFLDIAVPVIDTKGQFGGVLAAHVQWDWSRDIQLSVVPESATRTLIGVTVYGTGDDVLLDSGASGWTQPPEAPAVREGRRFRGSMIEHTAGGSTYLTGFSRSRGHHEYRGIGWLTVVRQPADRAFAEVRSLRRAITLWGCLVALGAGIASWFIAGQHARRLRSVRAAAERIREGDILSVLPRPKGQSEVAAMCGALDDLVEDLRARKEILTKENARLATDLHKGESARRG